MEYRKAIMIWLRLQPKRYWRKFCTALGLVTGGKAIAFAAEDQGSQDRRTLLPDPLQWHCSVDRAKMSMVLRKLGQCQLPVRSANHN